MNLAAKYLSLLALMFTCGAQAAFIERVAPFQGNLSEGFENVADPTVLNGLMGGNASFSGSGDTTLVVQNGDMFNLWDQRAPEGSYFLGGSAGYGSAATIEIRFEYPVSAFGGLFGHRVRPGVDSSGETEFVFYDNRNRELGRDRVFIGSEPGAVGAYWQFKRDVKRVTMTYIHPLCDSLTATLNPVNAKKKTRTTRSLATAQ